MSTILYEAAKGITTEHVNRVLFPKIKRYMRTHKKNTSKSYVNQLRTKDSLDDDILYIYGLSTDYAKYVSGKFSGYNSSSLPNFDKILQWVKQKGLSGTAKYRKQKNGVKYGPLIDTGRQLSFEQIAMAVSTNMKENGRRKTYFVENIVDDNMKKLIIELSNMDINIIVNNLMEGKNG